MGSRAPRRAALNADREPRREAAARTAVAPQPAAGSPEQVLALQRSAGNSAVGRLLRAPATITAAEQDELLTLTLQSAAYRADDARAAIASDRSAKARKHFSDVRPGLAIDLGEALQLAATTSGGPAVKAAADTFFGSAVALLKLVRERGWTGGAGLERKLSTLNLALQRHGYHFPLKAIEAGTIKPANTPAPRKLIRAARLGIVAGRTAMEAGARKLAAERKAGGNPAQLYGSEESTAHLREAARELSDVYQLDDEGLRALMPVLVDLGNVGLPLLKQGAKLDGARALWDAINELNRFVGLAPLMPYGTATATSRLDASAERLTALDEKRRKTAGKDWSTEDSKAQIGAEHEAMEAGEAALGAAKHPGGDHVGVTDVMQRVNEDIGHIEHARSLGYTGAVAYLASTALDTPSNVDTFAKSLIGNLIWALSSFLPVVGVVGRFSKLTGDVAAKADGALAAATGVFGAMLAQFSGGLPSGGAGDVSGRLEQLKDGLTEANSAFCNTRRAQSYILLARLMDAEPPRPDEDRAAYLASLETALRHALFGEIFERKLNDGPRPESAKVEGEAKRQLLVAATAPFGSVTDKGKLESATPALDLDYAKKMLTGAGAAAGMHFDPYDLVGARVPTAAREMGCDDGMDPIEINRLLAAGKPVRIPVSGWSWSRAALSRRTGPTGSFTRWSELYRDKRVSTNPDFTLAHELDAESVQDITAITIDPADLVQRTFHGKEIFVLDRVRFAAVGGPHFSGMFRGSKPPANFEMVYAFAKA